MVSQKIMFEYLFDNIDLIIFFHHYILSLIFLVFVRKTVNWAHKSVPFLTFLICFIAFFRYSFVFSTNDKK